MTNPIRFLWCDVETTGLDPNKDELIALGMYATDVNLKVVHHTELVLHHPNLDIRDPYVASMHEKNGLGARVRDPSQSIPFSQAVAWVRNFLEEVCPRGTPMESRPYVAGSTISFDRQWLTHHFPEFREHTHYRNLDVSTLLVMAIEWFPDIAKGAPPKRGHHLPISDILDSIEMFRYLRTQILVPNPAWLCEPLKASTP